MAQEDDECLEPLLGANMASDSRRSLMASNRGRFQYVNGVADSSSDGESSNDNASQRTPTQGTPSVPQAGELSLEESTAGGLGRHLGLASTIFLIFGRMVGTGIFAVTSSITNGVGSTGATLMVWMTAILLSFAGMSVWLELGCMIPRSGGTKVYLEAAFPRPKLLTTAVFGVQATLLCFTVSGLIVFATNILKAAGVDDSPEWLERGIAIGTGVAVIGTHIIFPKAGVQLMNAAGALKVSILMFVVLTGWVVMGGGVSRVKHPNESFKHAFHGSATSVSVYSTALFKAIGSLSGWANASWVLNEIQDPVKTLKRAGPIALSTCGVLYMFANLSYFAALTPREVANSGTNLAANFAEKVFGEAGARALSVFIAISALGNVMTISFAQGRLNQELAKEGLFPFPRFWASNWPFGSPSASLSLHFLPSLVILLAVPFGDGYNFIVDVEQYPDTVMNILVVSALLYLRWAMPNLERPFKVWLPVPLVFMAAQIFLFVTPWIPPPNNVGDTSLPYWLYPVVGLSMLTAGVAYWGMWRVALPYFGKYELRPKRSRLADGTCVVEYERVKRE